MRSAPPALRRMPARRASEIVHRLGSRPSAEQVAAAWLQSRGAAAVLDAVVISEGELPPGWTAAPERLEEMARKLRVLADRMTTAALQARGLCTRCAGTGRLVYARPLVRPCEACDG